MLQTRYENDLELSGRTIYGRVGRKKEMRSCLSNLDPLQNTPTLAKLHPKMITASTSRASVSRVRAAKKTCPRSSAPQFQLRQNFCHTAICIQKVPVCASSLADTTTSRFTIAPSDKTNDHRPVIVDHNFQFFFGGPLAIFGRTRHDSREIPRADSFGEALEKTERSKFQMARCPFRGNTWFVGRGCARHYPSRFCIWVISQ